MLARKLLDREIVSSGGGQVWSGRRRTRDPLLGTHRLCRVPAEKAFSAVQDGRRGGTRALKSRLPAQWHSAPPADWSSPLACVTRLVKAVFYRFTEGLRDDPDGGCPSARRLYSSLTRVVITQLQRHKSLAEPGCDNQSEEAKPTSHLTNHIKRAVLYTCACAIT